MSAPAKALSVMEQHIIENGLWIAEHEFEIGIIAQIMLGKAGTAAQQNTIRRIVTQVGKDIKANAASRMYAKMGFCHPARVPKITI